MRAVRIVIAGLMIAFAAVACDEQAHDVQAMAPQEPGPDSVGHYCGMLVINHTGPKGQIVLHGDETPVWFASVRDTLAFTMLPDELKNIAAIYVNDMAKATNWDHPEPGTWVEARDALFVVGSDARGGMGAPEVVPFGDKAAAEQFQAVHGGTLHTFDDVPQDYVLGASDLPPATPKEPDNASHTGH